MTDKQQPPEIPERIWIDAAGVGSANRTGVGSFYIEQNNTAGSRDITYARVQQADDARVEEIRERLNDNFRALGANEWRHQYATDIKYLLFLLPQLSRAKGQDAPFANDPTWDSFQQSIREYSEQVNAAERGISTAAPSTATPDNTAREDLEALVQLLVEDVSEYFLDTDPKVGFTRLPNIIRMRLSRHLPSTAPVPAGVEGGVVAWLLPQIKRRLQTVLDCENGMCTHCCEVLAGDLAPMIDRAIELCATPAPAESEKAEPLNGSEDSWMTL
jgi:hypothetical protein